MTNSELSERLDGLAYVILALVADMDRREQINADLLAKELAAVAARKRAEAGLEIAAATIESLAEQMRASKVRRLQMSVSEA